MGQPNIHHVIPVSFDGKMIYAGGPFPNWEPDERFAEIENVRIRQGDVEATSTGSTRVENGTLAWTLAVTSDREMKDGEAEVYALSTIHRGDGSTYEYEWGESVTLHREPTAGGRELPTTAAAVGRTS